MPYITRNESGSITAVFADARDDACEELDCGAPELASFLRHQLLGGGDPQARLSATDNEMSRLLEDLIDVLMDKGLVNWSDFAAPAQRKLLMRKDLRWRLHNDG